MLYLCDTSHLKKYMYFEKEYIDSECLKNRGQNTADFL